VEYFIEFLFETSEVDGKKLKMPKSTKIKLWRLILENPSYPSWGNIVEAEIELWEEYVERIHENKEKVPEDEKTIFRKEDEKYFLPTQYKYRMLKRELYEMPVVDVLELPRDIVKMISATREDVKSAIESQPQDLYEKDGTSGSLAWRQIQHIQDLHILANKAYSLLPEEPHPADGEDGFGSKQWSIFNAYRVLLTDPYWPSLAAHIGEEAGKFDDFAIRIQPNPFGGPQTKIVIDFESGKAKSVELSDEEFHGLLYDAWAFIFTELRVVANYGDPAIWVKEGINATCPNCPMQPKSK